MSSRNIPYNDVADVRNGNLSISHRGLDARSGERGFGIADRVNVERARLPEPLARGVNLGDGGLLFSMLSVEPH